MFFVFEYPEIVYNTNITLNHIIYSGVQRKIYTLRDIISQKMFKEELRCLGGCDLELIKTYINKESTSYKSVNLFNIHNIGI